MLPDPGTARLGGPRHPAVLVVSDRVDVRVRRWARAWVLLLSLVLFLLAVAGRLPQSPDSRTFEAAAQLGMLGLAVVGAVVLRWAEGVGGAVLLVCGVALGVLASLQWPPLASLVVALAFAVPALALLVMWQRGRARWHLTVLAAVVAVVLAGSGVASSSVYGYYFGAAHPQSATEVPTSPDIRWVWAGGAGPTAFRVTVRFADDDVAAGLRVTGADGDVAGTVAAPAWDRDHRTATLRVSGLEPATTYDYAVTVHGTADPGGTGSLRTFPAGPADVRIAFSACARVGSNGQVFDAIRELAPDLYLVTGDLHYGDVASDDPRAFHAVLARSLAAPAQAALYRSVPVAYTWDDHDYGTNDGDRTASARTAALEVYRTAVPHYPLALPGDDAPIAQAFTLGRVRVVLTDLRSARDPADKVNPSMMGPVQLAWFQQELATAADRHALVVWASSVPWIGPDAPGADDWSGYAEERATVTRMIADAGIPVLVLAGDAHMLAIDDGRASATTTGADVTVFHAGALDRPGSVKGGPYSQGTLPGAGQFGVVTVRDDGGATLEVDLSGRDWTGTERIHHRFTVTAADPTTHP